MIKRLDHLLILTFLIVTAGIGVAVVFFGISLSFPPQLLALIPNAVGNKAAPIPLMDVQNITMTSEQPLTQTQVKSSIASSVGGQNIYPTYNLKEYQLKWLVSVEDGSLAPVRAQVFVPVGEKGQQFPVIVYGAGSTGLDDRCAPSRENLKIGNMGNYRNYMISEASQGYVVVMPNYEGFDNPERNQHYFNKDNEARTMLSAAKAIIKGAKQVNAPIQPNAMFFGGYSQGGHAAFSAADYASTYAPDLKVAGVFGHGPTTNIAEFLKYSPNLAAYFVASYSDYYPAINPKVMLEPEWIGYLANARKICVNEGFGIDSTTVARVFADPFEKALMKNTLATDFPEINKVFVENNAGTSYTNIPTMIVQGTGDPIVPSASQALFLDQLCKRNVQVDFKEYRGVHHFSTRQVSFFDTNRWIDAISQGQTQSVNNTCAKRK
jgi:dienelactone hydrolase